MCHMWPVQGWSTNVLGKWRLAGARAEKAGVITRVCARPKQINRRKLDTAPGSG